MGFITSDRFLNVEYGSKLREELPKGLKLDLLVDFRDTRVFEGALNYPAILIGRRGAGSKGEMEAARIFSSETPLPELLKQLKTLRKKVANEPVIRSEAAEVFSFPRSQLKAEGWWLMPGDERKVFDRLRNCAGKKLDELTATSSAAFQGLATGSDHILVFDEVEDLGKTLKLTPRHEPQHCGCGVSPVEIEREALRPFLFGKDVGRWLIDWKRTWVMFPYDTYQKKETLYDKASITESWNLIPSGENIDRFNFANPDGIETIEKRFPKAWKYLRHHEEELREREHDRYAKNKSDSLIWYGAARPQNLDYFFRPKIMLQLLSRYNSVAYDPKGEFVFQAGGKGGGVYGVVPIESVNHRALQGFLSSKVADFLIKQVSSVYGGRFYSYADQFLKDLPICEPLLDRSSKTTTRVGELAEKTSDSAAEKLRVLHKLAAFPESFASDLAKCELDTVKRLCNKQPQSENLKIIQDAIRVEASLYGFEVHYGTQTPFEFEMVEHAECLAEAFRNQKLQNIRRKDVLGWRLPVTASGCKKLLELVAGLQVDLSKVRNQVSSTEEKLNDLVFEMYGLSKEEQKVVDSFLERYSSMSKAAAEEIEHETAEKIEILEE